MAEIAAAAREDDSAISYTPGVGMLFTDQLISQPLRNTGTADDEEDERRSDLAGAFADADEPEEFDAAGITDDDPYSEMHRCTDMAEDEENENEDDDADGAVADGLVPHAESFPPSHLPQVGQ